VVYPDGTRAVDGISFSVKEGSSSAFWVRTGLGRVPR